MKAPALLARSAVWNVANARAWRSSRPQCLAVALRVGETGALVTACRLGNCFYAESVRRARSAAQLAVTDPDSRGAECRQLDRKFRDARSSQAVVRGAQARLLMGALSTRSGPSKRRPGRSSRPARAEDPRHEHRTVKPWITLRGHFRCTAWATSCSPRQDGTACPESGVSLCDRLMLRTRAARSAWFESHPVWMKTLRISQTANGCSTVPSGCQFDRAGAPRACGSSGRVYAIF